LMDLNSNFLKMTQTQINGGKKKKSIRKKRKHIKRKTRKY